jgi:hypothetical protein
MKLVSDNYKLCNSQHIHIDWNNVVSTATRYRLESPRARTPVGVRFPRPIQANPKAHPPSYTMDMGSLSPR